MSKVDLSSYNNSWYQPGSRFKRAVWFVVNATCIQSKWMPSSGIRKFWLRLFGAKLGKGVVIKPRVNIKYPWLLEIGDYTWIGEGVWIDNLDKVKIGKNVCVSQEAYLLCGNHDYSKKTFDLIVKPITIEDGAWVGARAIVCPGVMCHSHSVLSVNSVATMSLESYGVYQGNPASLVKTRKIED